MSGYTKGPWQLNGFYVDQDAATRVATVSNWRMSGEAAYSEAKANARLIAAAPDLLEALESVEREHELLRWMKNCELRRPRGSFGIAVQSDELALEWQSHRNNLDKLAEARRAAIAKARGEK